MQFVWPVNTPLEVHELVGPERAMIVCLIECAFGLFGYTLNVLHFLIYLYNCDDTRLAWFVFFVTIVQYSVFYSFKRQRPLK
ncbi:hypothetical protein COOONC_12742 [Cooperia oncophora]